MNPQSARRRVVITGRGAITPIGLNVADFWASLMAGRSGVGPITSFDASGLPVRIAGEVKGFDPTDWMERKVSRRIDRFAHYAIASTLQALEESKLEIDDELAPRVGVLVGSGFGATLILHHSAINMVEKGFRGLTPWITAGAAIDSAAGEVALRVNAQGPSGAVSTACASGTDAVGMGMRMIMYGNADVVLAGGSDNSVTSVDVGSAAMSRALSKRNDDPERASRPFDTDRDGFVVAAGAGMVVLEELDHALSRGAPILAEVIGYGASTDAYHPTAPHPTGRGARQAMQAALTDAGVRPEDIDYINAHGTSTVLNDRTESQAIRTLFGEHALRIPISSTKSMTGHMIGAAGVVELMATVNAMLDGRVPPTINCDNPEDTELNYVPHKPQEHRVDVAMSNSFGFAGHNAVAVVRRWQG
ncbi:3-oxoacyl-[acyl-carrier-protein] synthase 2 [Actinocatenispora thailandica]|uniref:3-oxoacyl-[acyl-carrier-protein] synthase 2 n=1 Tax=Actinocatenispora thailandica TaxID=227318 RepID=A0A7R7HVQ2_9ACTN|nr:beta-ketoacyl-ACP synthase II [Actinocatenispora thailandica]BCJ33139.1 3-oxoacyl-[acyl-carrier-protein] synthase 2 [Actinocatenispora thailandica]